MTEYIRLLFLRLSFVVLAAAAVEQAWEVNEHHTSHSDAIRFGDMLLSPAQLARYARPGVPSGNSVRAGATIKENSYNRWPNNIVPYKLSGEYGPKSQQLLRTALLALETMACFAFVERTDEPDYLYIAPKDGCYSFVGRTGGRQLVSLSADCLADYIIWHELMHALGFEHEHQRPDRDRHIRVEYKNVQAGQMVNFEKLRPDAVDYLEPYDYRSIMHYNSFSFGRFDKKSGKRLATMIPIKTTIELIDNVELSNLDVRKLRGLGNCKPQVKLPDDCSDSDTFCIELAEKGFCSRPGYDRLMARECKKSCNKCLPSATAAPQSDECKDLESNCARLAQNGFCTNDFYKDHWVRCAKSCKLC